MARMFRKISRYVLPVALLMFAFVAVAVSALLSRYPWTSITSDYGNQRLMRFLSPWPMNPLKQEMHDKKKKRLPKAEMERLYALDLRRMEFINVPLFDLFLNEKVKHTAGDTLFRSLGFGEFPWPWLETERAFGDNTGPQRISYVPVPTPYGVSLHEGVLMAPGEEMDFPFPVSKLRRSFRFYVLPLNTGTFRVSLGQYAWARTFSESDVNKLQFFSVAVNDPAAMVAKVSATSLRAFLIQAHIAQAEMSGRIPIQVAAESSLWSLNPKYLKAPENGTVADAGSSSAEELAETPAGPGPTGDSTAEPNVEPTPEPSPEPSPEPTPEASKKASDVAKSESGAAAQSSKDLLDSLAITANPQVLQSSAASTVALGYNVMVVHWGAMPKEIMESETLFSKVTPQLHSMAQDSVAFDLKKDTDAVRGFRSFVLGDSLPRFHTDAQVLFKDALNRLEGLNIYRHLRNFGYQVMSVAPAPVFGFSKGLAWTSEGTLFSERILDSNDWDFAKKRVKIDRDAAPLSGLEAVFQSKEQVLAPPLVTSDYASVSKYFEKISGEMETFPDWRANEIFMPDDRDYYSSTAVYQFEKWTQNNRQVRLLGHIWLGGLQGLQRPSLKDFAQGLWAAGFSHAPREIWNGRFSEALLLDRAFGDVRDTVKVRRLAHRTIWVVIVPHEKGLRVWMEIPGVLKKGPLRPMDVSMDSLRATVLSVIGVPLSGWTSEGDGRIAGKSVEVLPSASPAPVSAAPLPLLPEFASFERLDRFVLRIAPGKARCTPFVWRAQKPVIHMSASHPVLEMHPSRKEFRVFPCSASSSWVSLDWFQRVEDVRALPGETSKEALLRTTGGEFVLDAGSQELSPVFYFGENFKRLVSPLFAFSHLPDTVLNGLFMRPWNTQSTELVSTLQSLDAVKRSLFPPELREGTQVFFARESSVRNEGN
jgi:hypothetical protein